MTVRVMIDESSCDECMDCIESCPAGCLSLYSYEGDDCWICESCVDICEYDAIRVEKL